MPKTLQQGANFEHTIDFGDYDLSTGYTFSVQIRDKRGGDTVYVEDLSYTPVNTAKLKQGKLDVLLLGGPMANVPVGGCYVAAKATDGSNVYREGERFVCESLTIDAPVNIVEQAYSYPDINSLNDVNAASPVDGNVLRYDDVTGKWIPEAIAGVGNSVSTLNGQDGDIVLDKTWVGLDNLDNTSDANKPISSATAAALTNKASSDPVVLRTNAFDDTNLTEDLDPNRLNDWFVVHNDASGEERKVTLNNAGAKLPQRTMGATTETALQTHVGFLVHYDDDTNPGFYTLDDNANEDIPNGTLITLLQLGTAAVSFVDGTNVNFIIPAGYSPMTTGVGTSITAIHLLNTDDWWISGDMAAL